MGAKSPPVNRRREGERGGEGRGGKRGGGSRVCIPKTNAVCLPAKQLLMLAHSSPFFLPLPKPSFSAMEPPQTPSSKAEESARPSAVVDYVFTWYTVHGGS